MGGLRRNVKSAIREQLAPGAPLGPLGPQQCGRRLRSLLAVTAHMVAGYLAIGCARPEVPLLETPELAGFASDLRFRMESEGSGRLLIKNRERDGVYLYDPGLGSLSLVSVDRWQFASGQIGDTCGINFAPTSELVGELRIAQRQLRVGNRRIRTAGKVVLVFNGSPRSNFVAVLSADDRFRLPSLLPFLGGPGAPSGQFYLQVFSVPELRPLGHASPVTRWPHEVLMICWSPDERYVIYTDVEARRMCIVPNEGKGTE